MTAQRSDQWPPADSSAGFRRSHAPGSNLSSLCIAQQLNILPFQDDLSSSCAIQLPRHTVYDSVAQRAARQSAATEDSGDAYKDKKCRRVFIESAPLEHLEQFFGLRPMRARGSEFHEKEVVHAGCMAAALEIRVQSSYDITNMEENLKEILEILQGRPCRHTPSK